jgi:hypothetical protein
VLILMMRRQPLVPLGVFPMNALSATSLVQRHSSVPNLHRTGQLG